MKKLTDRVKSLEVSVTLLELAMTAVLEKLIRKDHTKAVIYTLFFGEVVLFVSFLIYLYGNL